MTSVKIALASLVVLLASQDANAACVLSGARPTVPLPTMEIGQEFSFLASSDCTTVRFVVPGAGFSTIPKPGSDVGTKDRTYKVRLTESEWSSLIAPRDTTFTWTITGTATDGTTTRLTTTNELDFRQTLDLFRGADAQLEGVREYADAGDRVAFAGDVDGDGRDDLLIGAPRFDDEDTQAGAAYVVLGPVTGRFDLSDADALVIGEDSDDRAGWGVSSAGDMDGDGFADVLVGAPEHNEGVDGNVGAAYLLLGPVTGRIDASSADATLVGENGNDRAGYSLASIGDMNSDGHEDILIGADNGPYRAGAAYLVRGPIVGTLELAAADAKIVGERRYDSLGAAPESVAGAGDLDADGNADVIVGAHENGRDNNGAAYVLLGPVSGRVDVAYADADLRGESNDDEAGYAVASAGDFDGDGHDDILVGAPENARGGERAGAAYVVLGPVPRSLDLSSADAIVVGEEADDYLGGSLAGAGDVYGDGGQAILIGASRSDRGGVDSGAAYLVRGPTAGALVASRADLTLIGEERSNAGASVAGNGDADGDGRADLLIGAPELTIGLIGAVGATYLLYGGNL